MEKLKVKCTKKPVLAYGDLFSGIGCVPYALRELNIPFVYKFACDINQSAISNLINNFQPQNVYKDIRDITELPKIDFLTAGFPCQPFSTNNSKKKGSKHKSFDLFSELYRCLLLCDPEQFLFENVAGLTHRNHQEYFESIKAKLKDTEYICTYTLMNSKDYGAAQSRKRLWIYGHKPNIIPATNPNPCARLVTLQQIIDFYQPTTELLKNSDFAEKLSHLPDGFYIDNGNSTGRFSRLHNLNNQQWSYCIGASCINRIYRIESGIIKYRNITVAEVMQLFGLDKYQNVCSDRQFLNQMGNGMDIHILKLILSKINFLARENV
jgi:DNA-cytosine methyltransferase